MSDASAAMSAFFILKKLAGALAQPLPMAIAMLIIGWFALWTVTWRKLGLLLSAIGILLLILASNGSLADRLLAAVEGSPASETSGAIAIPALPKLKSAVVLGGGHIPDSQLAPENRLAPSTLLRMLTAIRVYRNHPGTRLILSGGAVFEESSEAETMAQFAMDFGVRKSDLVLDTVSLDTAAQAANLASLVGKAPFYLITSAAHMPRSVDFFRRRGMSPVPLVAEHRARRLPSLSPVGWVPQTAALGKTDSALHELLGQAWGE